MQAARQLPQEPTGTKPFHIGLSGLAGISAGDIFVDFKQGDVYRLVRLAADLTGGVTAPGTVLCYKAAGGPQFIVTNDVSDAIDGAVAPLVAGVVLGTFTDSVDATDDLAVYIFVLIKGKTTLTLTDGSVVAGNALIPDTAVDGGCKTWTATTANPTLTQLEQGVISVFAYALANDDASADVVALVNVRS